MTIFKKNDRVYHKGLHEYGKYIRDNLTDNDSALVLFDNPDNPDDARFVSKNQLIIQNPSDLESLLRELGADEPFDNETHKYTEDGLCACAQLLRIVSGLHIIGAISETEDDVEKYIDNIVKLDF